MNETQIEHMVRRHVMDALETAMKELGEPEHERRARAIAELNADAREIKDGR